MYRGLKWNPQGHPNWNRKVQSRKQHFGYVQVGERLKNVPVRIVHGDGDEIVDSSNSRYIVDNFKKGGVNDIKLEILKGEGHAIVMSYIPLEYTDKLMQGKL